MRRHLWLPLISAGMLIFAVASALYNQRAEPESPPPVPPPTTPFGHTVAGLGIVEPANEASTTSAIAVGANVAGVVTRVHVRINQPVETGALLFEQDLRQAEANLEFSKAALLLAQAQLRKLEMQPRPEEVPPQEAQVRFAEANVRQLRDQYERDQRMPPGAVAEQDRVAHEQAFHGAEHQLALAKANLALLKAGAWAPDKAIAYAAVVQARAQVEQARVAVELLRVRAPMKGTILQVNIRPGEYVSTAAGQSLILMGNLNPLHVRVNVDEEDLPRLKLKAPACAKIRGDPRQEQVPLHFERLEPYVVPKVSLTGANTERVDTRVVQVIYSLDSNHPLVRNHKVLVGQIVDVFIDTGQERQRASANPR